MPTTERYRAAWAYGTVVATLESDVSFRRRIWLLLSAMAIVFALLPSCAAPVLPIPPPTALIEGPPDENGIVVVTGQGEPSSYVMCLNESSMSGVIELSDDDGNYTIRIVAMSGDILTVRHLDGGMSRQLIVPEPDP